MARTIRVSSPSTPAMLAVVAVTGLALVTSGVALMSFAFALVFAGIALVASAAALAWLAGGAS